MSDIVKIYVPTPTKKPGVAEFESRPYRCDPGDYVAINASARFWSYYADRSWFLDKAKALAAAEAARLKRIASLKKQIEKLEKIGPFVVKESST